MTAKEYYKSILESRRAWEDSVPRQCMWCGDWNGPFETHEIQRRSASQRSWGHSANFLRLCGSFSKRNCHDSVFATLPHVSQLACKLLKDENSFSFEKWLEIRGTGELELEDVLREVERLRPILCPAKKNVSHRKGLVF